MKHWLKVRRLCAAGGKDQHGDYGSDRSGVLREDFNPKKGSPAEKIQTQLKELYEKNKSSAAK